MLDGITAGKAEKNDTQQMGAILHSLITSNAAAEEGSPADVDMSVVDEAVASALAPASVV